MPAKGPDEGKVNQIKTVLRENPKGLWIREIARRAGLDKSTVSIYITKHMSREVEEVFSVNGGLIKVIKLKR